MKSSFVVLVFVLSPVRARQLEVYRGMKRVAAIAAIMLFVACLARAQGVARLAQPPDLMVSVWYNGGKARAPMLSPFAPNSREEWLLQPESPKLRLSVTECSETFSGRAGTRIVRGQRRNPRRLPSKSRPTGIECGLAAGAP